MKKSILITLIALTITAICAIYYPMYQQLTGDDYTPVQAIEFIISNPQYI